MHVLQIARIIAYYLQVLRRIGHKVGEQSSGARREQTSSSYHVPATGFLNRMSGSNAILECFPHLP